MSVDLHTHSHYSDGSDSPAAVVGEAILAGLTAVALTDHDTLEGVPEAIDAGGGIEVIPGVEISCEWSPGAMHMTVLFLEPREGPLQNALDEIRAGRDLRNHRIVERLEELGVDIRYEEVAAEAGRGLAGRPHIAAVLVRKGVVDTPDNAFRDLLGGGRPAYVSRFRLAPEQAIRLSLESRAVPILSHPHTLGLNSATDYASTLRHLKATGLVGLEAHYAEYTPEDRLELASVARSHGLIPSGGSDYHGTYRPGVSVGVGHGDLKVPGEVLEELRAARP
ncbi:MAG: PHP domain-containing protein [Acidimicrobiia bacterium]